MCSVSELVPYENVPDAGLPVFATRTWTTTAKGKGQEGNTTWETRDWSDDSDVEQPRRRFAAYEEALLRPKRAPRPPSETAKTWAKDV